MLRIPETRKHSEISEDLSPELRNCNIYQRDSGKEKQIIQVYPNSIWLWLYCFFFPMNISLEKLWCWLISFDNYTHGWYTSALVWGGEENAKSLGFSTCLPCTLVLKRGLITFPQAGLEFTLGDRLNLNMWTSWEELQAWLIRFLN